MSIQHELQKNRKEWLDKGIEQGIKQGKEETQIKFVNDMYGDGLSIERIAKISHLTVEEVEKLLYSNLEDSKNDENKNK